MCYHLSPLALLVPALKTSLCTVKLHVSITLGSFFSCNGFFIRISTDSIFPNYLIA